MKTRNERAKDLINALAKAAIAGNECNFTISCYGSRSTIESEQGQEVLTEATIDNVTISINLNDVEDE